MYLSLKNVDFAYSEDKKVLNNINMDIKKSQFVTILGSNGSGKSTLNNILSFLEKPTSGEIILHSIDKSDIYLVFQNPTNQFVKTSVIEELAFGLENINATREEITNKIDEYSKMFDITHLLNRDPYTLSGGEQQKIMLVANLLLEPKVLILDEAIEMIDEQSKNNILSYLNVLKHEKQMSIIMVTHNMQYAALSDYIYIINDSTISIEGSSECVFSNFDEIEKARLEIPIAYYLSEYTDCNYEIVRDLHKFKEYYDTIS